MKKHFYNQLAAGEILWCTKKTAKFLNVSTQWLEIGRCKGYGPPFVRVTKRLVRYRLSDVMKWLEQRTYKSTSEADVQGGA